MLWKDGKKKALTLSYDDGTIHDRRFIDMLNKYGIKCTFNLISVTMAKMGITATFVSPDCTEEELNAAFQENTKLVNINA